MFGSRAADVAVRYIVQVEDQGSRQLETTNRKIATSATAAGTALDKTVGAAGAAGAAHEQAARKVGLLGRAQALAGRAIHGFGNVLRRVGSWVFGYARQILALGAAYLSFRTIKSAITDTIEFGTATRRLMAMTGLDVKTASSWIAVAKVRGLEATKLITAFRTLEVVVSKAAHGNETASKTLRSLGVSFRDIKRGDISPILLKVADTFSKMKNPADRARAAQTLFGKNAAALLPLLVGGRKAILENLRMVQRYGATLDGKGLKSLAAYNKAHQRSQAALLGFKLTLGAALLPTLTKAEDALSKFFLQFRQGRGFGGKVHEELDKIVKAGGRFISQWQRGVGTGGRVKKLFEEWSEAIKKLIPFFLDFVEASIDVTKHLAKFVEEHPKVTKLAESFGGLAVSMLALRKFAKLTGITDTLGILARLNTRLGLTRRASNALAASWRTGRLGNAVRGAVRTATTALGTFITASGAAGARGARALGARLARGLRGLRGLIRVGATNAAGAAVGAFGGAGARGARALGSRLRAGISRLRGSALGGAVSRVAAFIAGGLGRAGAWATTRIGALLAALMPARLTKGKVAGAAASSGRTLGGIFGKAFVLGVIAYIGVNLGKWLAAEVHKLGDRKDAIGWIMRHLETPGIRDSAGRLKPGAVPKSLGDAIHGGGGARLGPAGVGGPGGLGGGDPFRGVPHWTTPGQIRARASHERAAVGVGGDWPRQAAAHRRALHTHGRDMHSHARNTAAHNREMARHRAAVLAHARELARDRVSRARENTLVRGLGRAPGGVGRALQGTVRAFENQAPTALDRFTKQVNSLTIGNMTRLQTWLKAQVAKLQRVARPDARQQHDLERLSADLEAVDQAVTDKLEATDQAIQSAIEDIDKGGQRFQNSIFLQGVNLESAKGQRMIADYGKAQIAQLSAQRAPLERLIADARRAHADPNTIRQYQNELTDLNDKIQQAEVDMVQAQVAAIEAEVQKVTDDLSRREADLHARLTIRGIDESSFRGQRAIARFQERAVGQLRNERDRLENQLQHATGQVAAALQDQLRSLKSAILSARAAAREARRAARLAKAQERVARATHAETLADTALQRLELQQRLAGTFEAGGAQRADFITSVIIPTINKEISALQKELDVARKQHNAELARQISEEIASKQNDILQAQLDAQEAIKSNTDGLRELTGTIAFESQGAVWTDMLGVGVGA